MTEPTKQELAVMVAHIAGRAPITQGDFDDAIRLLQRWHRSQLVFVTTPRPWSVEQ